MNYFNLSFLIILFTMSQSSFAQIDPHSCSRPGEVRITHIDLNLNVNFDSQTLSGGATISIERLLTDKPLWLDIKGLEIKHISDAEKGEELSYTIHPEIEWLGTPLEIKLLPQTHLVKIEYTVPAGAPALQWLKPEQTLSKKASFLFSQSQAILARTWIPLQDSPGIRFSFDAKIQVPNGMIALMSAENPQSLSADGTYSFVMDQPIPSYLIALAVGDVQFRPIGDRTGVYAIPSLIEIGRAHV
jgi:aminopeptidase N